MFRKADVQRLKGMLQALDDSEANYQARGLPVIPRSTRATDMLNAEALRSVLAVIEKAKAGERNLSDELMQGVQEMSEHRGEQPKTVNVPRIALATAYRLINRNAEALRECHAPTGNWDGKGEALTDYLFESAIARNLKALLDGGDA